jgi:hypothetical protein
MQIIDFALLHDFYLYVSTNSMASFGAIARSHLRDYVRRVVFMGP